MTNVTSSEVTIDLSHLTRLPLLPTHSITSHNTHQVQHNHYTHLEIEGSLAPSYLLVSGVPVALNVHDLLRKGVLLHTDVITNGSRQLSYMGHSSIDLCMPSLSHLGIVSRQKQVHNSTHC